MKTEQIANILCTQPWSVHIPSTRNNLITPFIRKLSFTKCVSRTCAHKKSMRRKFLWNSYQNCEKLWREIPRFFHAIFRRWIFLQSKLWVHLQKIFMHRKSEDSRNELSCALISKCVKSKFRFSSKALPRIFIASCCCIPHEINYELSAELLGKVVCDEDEEMEEQTIDLS